MASYLKAAARNPGTTLAAGVATVGLTAVAAPALVATPVLGVLGFTADGVVGGSIAAGVQSVLGNVAVGSVFATAQSAAAGGGGAAVVAGATQIVGGIAAVGAAAGKVLSWVLSGITCQRDEEVEDLIKEAEPDRRGGKVLVQSKL